jgi:hypothetical protein
MSDDRNRKGQQDRSRIDVSEDYELRYWTKELGVSPDQPWRKSGQALRPCASTSANHRKRPHADCHLQESRNRLRPLRAALQP